MKKHLLILVLASIVLGQGCKPIESKLTLPGVSLELAQMRRGQLEDVHYKLFLKIPPDRTRPIVGNVSIVFGQKNLENDLIIDFKGDSTSIQWFLLNGKEEEYVFVNQHIVVSSKHLSEGENIVEIGFTSTDQALNRSDDFMYTLFVPDRASTAFPCFDQPDIKALFSLKLEIPSQWNAVSNGRQIDYSMADERKVVFFASDKPVSTYLMAFAAGVFEVATTNRDGREINVYHRETDLAKVERNINEIFDLHFNALQWLEDYTGIKYPFGKFDIALLPGFQYSGMEHPGAIYYRDSRLFLQTDAPLTSVLSRASLIAHETAHMWFGNLVTMKWFDDVWLKEVFAGFMADKVVKPLFPEIDHDLQFLLTHYPRAYSIDRTAGTHSIKQELANMNMAGTLYGSIIYNKAPIAFKQLEWLMGEEDFISAVREYLEAYSYGNSDWSDLAMILDKHSEIDLLEWSEAWIEGKGLPRIYYSYLESPEGECKLELALDGHFKSEAFPVQVLFPWFFDCNEETTALFFDKTPQVFDLNKFNCMGSPLLVNGRGGGYGYFVPDAKTRIFLLKEAPFLEDGYAKAAAFLTMHEDYLNGKIDNEPYLAYLEKAIANTNNSLITKFLLGNLEEVFWQFLSVNERYDATEKIEKTLFQKLSEVLPGSKSQYLDAFVRTANSGWAQDVIVGLLSGSIVVDGLDLSEDQRFWMVAQLFLLENALAQNLLAELLEETTNPDRCRRIEYLAAALSTDLSVRKLFFESLKKLENRRPEPWALDGLSLIHHPLRAESAMKHLAESLELLEEIQRTGDIFFPFNWLQTTLSGHNSNEARQIVEKFLDDPILWNENLRLKTLQAADYLFRSTERVELFSDIKVSND